MGKRWGLIFTLVGVIAVVAVIGTVVWRGGKGNAAAARPVTWTTYAANVVGVRRIDEQSVLIEVSLPAGGSNCAKDPRTDMVQDQEAGRPAGRHLRERRVLVSQRERLRRLPEARAG
jgi:hypothetical protein